MQTRKKQPVWPADILVHIQTFKELCMLSDTHLFFSEDPLLQGSSLNLYAVLHLTGAKCAFTSVNLGQTAMLFLTLEVEYELIVLSIFP